jgi:hypothetical protein
MNIYEKAGNLIIDVAKMIIGGVILGAIMIGKDSADVTILYIVGATVSLGCILVGFGLYSLHKLKNN